MKQTDINQLEQKINKNYRNITGIIVQKENMKIYENYFNDYDENKPIHIFSVTKSIFCTLIGIAIDKGFIESVNQKILDFFPDYTVTKSEKTIQAITIKDILTMTVPYKYRKEPYRKFFKSKDWMKFALDLIGGNNQKGDFLYSAIIGPHILSGILTKATKQSAYGFARERLFLPLGIEVDKSFVIRTKKQQMEFYKTKYMSCWATDAQGITTASWGLTLSPADMIKIGQLYLNQGKWDGKQIVSSKWISESTKEHSKWNELAYGYLWWIIDSEEKTYAAIGDGGNVIYVNTAKNIVIAITSYFKPNVTDRIDFIKNHIEPYI